MSEPANAVFDLTCELISRVSVTPEDAGCQEIIGQRLNALGFSLHQYNTHGVHNLWATRGHGSPHLLFAGHTDVVPAGPVSEWQSPPFTPTVSDGLLIGRGAADMKSSLAAMIVAVETLLREHPAHPGTLSFLITSDEEGEAIHGTAHAIRALHREGIKPDYCVVGEPSSSVALGDVVRCGRRGSLNAHLIVHGVQGHVAYPSAARNPIHQAMPVLAKLADTVWDAGNDFYPPTTLQISNIQAGTGAGNVIPGTLSVDFNLRFNTEQTAQGLQTQIQQMLADAGLEFELTWQLSGAPFLTQPGQLCTAVSEAIYAHTGMTTEMSTSGGTSDGRFIAPWDNHPDGPVEVVELGPINATIHKINESVRICDLLPLSQIYNQIIVNLLKLKQS
ncbi:MAG: succinyl-diaminopimelate desuccinylase [Gammaproteobacteria bacterium TMED92]|nr:MAG: succinyl-diaminopimelate desuccinylase [Gammaproteobacteria bacterium TMED92]